MLFYYFIIFYCFGSSLFVPDEKKNPCCVLLREEGGIKSLMLLNSKLFSCNWSKYTQTSLFNLSFIYFIASLFLRSILYLWGEKRDTLFNFHLSLISFFSHYINEVLYYNPWACMHVTWSLHRLWTWQAMLCFITTLAKITIGPKLHFSYVERGE